MNEIFFTSDLHFGHTNIIKYSGRPYKDTEEMDEALIANWNAKVKAGDLVYMLGDFTFQKNVAKYRDRLNGAIYFIIGNHDHTSRDYYKTNKDAFIWMRDVAHIKVAEQQIMLSHYPHASWESMRRGKWMLCGHEHGGMAEIRPEATKGKILDVGVDVHNYSPLSFEEVRVIMAGKTAQGLFSGHHNGN